MKKITVALFAFAALIVTTNTTHAQVATSTPNVQPGGYSTPCFYMRQTNEWKPGYVCNDNDYSASRFAFDTAYRTSILVPFLNHIFVDVPAKYGWNSSTRSY